MRMNLDEAKAECERWFAYLQNQEDQAKALAQLASDRRSGRCDAKEGERRLAAIRGNGVTVYDGGNLQQAVKVLLSHIAQKEQGK